MKTVKIWRVLAWCVVLLAMALAVYRAKTQPIAHDEALEYEWYLDGGVARVLGYNPTNHILFTLLAKPIVWALGTSELKLRAASLLGAAVYLMAVYLLCRRLFGEEVLFLLAVALLCLNPQVLDFMAAARGYILGLAGLLTGMYAMARLAERGEFEAGDHDWRRWTLIASLALAASVVANVTNFVPVLCLVTAFSAFALGGWKQLWKFRQGSARDFAKYFLAPGAVAGFSLLWPFAIQMRPSAFYAGVSSATHSLADFFTSSFLYKWTDDIWASSLGAVAPATGSWQEWAIKLGIYVLLPLLFCWVAAGVVLARRGGSRTSGACRIFGGAAVGCVVLIAVLHVVARAHYPNSRLCLFLVPLFTVGALLAGKEIAARLPNRGLRTVGVLLAVLVVADYAASIQVTEFRYNAYDTISLKVYQAIADDAQRQGLKSVRVGGTWWYEPEINFYRRKFKATWMPEYDVVDKSYFWRSPNALAPMEYDYFVFIPASDPGLTGVRTVFRDELRQLIVVAKVRR